MLLYEVCDLGNGTFFKTDCNLVFHCVRSSRKQVDNWGMNRSKVVFSDLSASQHRRGEQWGGYVEVQDPWVEIILLNTYFKVLTILYLYINLYEYVHTYCPLSTLPLLPSSFFLSGPSFLFFWPCESNHSFYVKDCNSHVVARRQHPTVLPLRLPSDGVSTLS